jgi:hypothetical protein
MNLYKVGTKSFTLAFFLRLTGLLTLALFLRFARLGPGAVQAQGQKYPPLSEYMMASDEEIALDRSVAPENVSSRATVKILTTSGYKVAAEGDNGFVCMVMRGWSAPLRTNSFLQLRSISLNSPVNGRVIEREAALPHHFFQVTIAESITQIPAHAEKDDFALVMTPFEWIGFGHSRLPV